MIRTYARIAVVSVAVVLVAAAVSGCRSKKQSLLDGAEREAMEDKASGGHEAKPKHRNRLADEKSPYLLQHAHNPVDWYPWGAEAFEKAKREDRPIFLSIGYSTCHWCHVMAHESFEDPTIAALMNDAFVCIKVDREERPDIDHLYMTVCQVMTGSGGWPLTILMTPDGKPFYAATYLPKSAREGRPGVRELAVAVAQLWKTKREGIVKSANNMAEFLQKAVVPVAGEALDESVLKQAYERFAESFDAEHGGFGGAPKFPTPHELLFLLRWWKRSQDPKALEMVETTLDAIWRGGICDHVGFGFHRYATDEQWLVPHFEKMLYDQAMLVMAYTEAFQATGKPAYERTAREVLSYVLRDMISPEGGFYSAEDADSEGGEGKFYLWTAQEVRKVLGDEDAELVCRVFGVEEEGNFTEEASGCRLGANILHLGKPLAETAKEMGISEDDLRGRLERARRKLFAVREKRVHPHKDDKVLTDWNGLMIAALAKAARAFDESEYTRAAERAADFLLKKLRTPDGRLLHRYRDGEADIPGYAEDYAFLTWGLIELYEATFDVRHLEAALALNDQLLKHFWDDQAGGFFHAADDAEKLIVRQKQVYESAVPSANSVGTLNLIRLGRITGNPAFEEKADEVGRAFSKQVTDAPVAFPLLLSAVGFSLGPSYEVVIAGKPDADDTRAMLRTLRRPFLPNKVVLLRPDGDSPVIARIAPYTTAQTSVDGKATAYVCRNFACKAPTTDAAKMLELLGVTP